MKSAGVASSSPGHRSFFSESSMSSSVEIDSVLDCDDAKQLHSALAQIRRLYALSSDCSAPRSVALTESSEGCPSSTSRTSIYFGLSGVRSNRGMVIPVRGSWVVSNLWQHNSSASNLHSDHLDMVDKGSFEGPRRTTAYSTWPTQGLGAGDKLPEQVLSPAQGWVSVSKVQTSQGPRRRSDW